MAGEAPAKTLMMAPPTAGRAPAGMGEACKSNDNDRTKRWGATTNKERLPLMRGSSNDDEGPLA